MSKRETLGLSHFPSQIIRDGEIIGNPQRVIFGVTGEELTCTDDGSSAGSYEGS